MRGAETRCLLFQHVGAVLLLQRAAARQRCAMEMHGQREAADHALRLRRCWARSVPPHTRRHTGTCLHIHSRATYSHVSLAPQYPQSNGARSTRRNTAPSLPKHGEG